MQHTLCSPHAALEAKQEKCSTLYDCSLCRLQDTFRSCRGWDAYQRLDFTATKLQGAKAQVRGSTPLRPGPGVLD